MTNFGGFMSDIKTLSVNGLMLYRVSLEGIESVKIEDINEMKSFLKSSEIKKIEPVSLIELLENENEIIIKKLITGQTFLENVRSGVLTNENGFVSEVIIDGFLTNIRFCFSGYQDLFGFLVDETFFESLMEDRNILINWNPI